MAESLEQTDKTLEIDIAYIKSEMGVKYKKLSADEKEAKLKQLKNKIRVCKQVLSTYELDIQIANDRDAEPYKAKYEEKMKEVRLLEEAVGKLKNDNFKNQVNPFSPMEGEAGPQRRELESMGKQELFQHGDAKLRDADNRLDEVTKILVDAKTLQDDVGKELARIEEQLVKTYEAAKDTQSMLKRSKELINYFFRQVQTDKIIMCCLIVVVLLVLVVIILGFAGVKNKNFNNKAVPNQ